MIFLFLFLILSDLNAQYKSVLWITNSQKDVEEILKFRKEKSLDFSFTLVSNVFKDTSRAIEIADNLFNFYPVMAVFFPSKTGIRNIENYHQTPISFSLFLDYYCKIKQCFQQGFFSFYSDINDENSIALKEHNYKWGFGGIVKSGSGFKDIKDFKSVFFEVLKSSSDIYLSSGSFFVVDDVSGSTSSVILLKDIFSDNKLRFLSVYDLIKISTPTDIPMNVEPVDFSVYLKCEKARNYLSYLLLLISDLESETFLSDEFMRLYMELFVYFDYICSDDVDYVEDIRRVTKQIYQLLEKDVPYFVYYDFLNNSFSKKYKKNISDGNLYFDSLFDQLIKRFEIKKIESNYLFSINLSTSLSDGEIHIYCDINKRRNAGIDEVIGKNEKIDSLYLWEYAFVVNIKKKNVILYKAGYRNYSIVSSYPIDVLNDTISFKINSRDISGNLMRWNYVIPIYNNAIIGGVYEVSDNKFLTPSE